MSNQHRQPHKKCSKGGSTVASRLHNKVVKKGAKQKAVPVRIVSEPSPVSSKYADEDRKWRAQSDLRTLQDAERIRADKSRHNAAKVEAKTMMKDLDKVCK